MLQGEDHRETTMTKQQMKAPTEDIANIFHKASRHFYSTNETAHRLLASCAKQAIISSDVTDRFPPMRKSRIKSVDHP